MENENIIDKIAEMEREIAMLPGGSITKKKIKEKEYYYHRIVREGRRVENYIRFEDIEALKGQIKKRKELEKELKSLKADLKIGKLTKGKKDAELNFKTIVRTGNLLKAQIEIVRKYKKRKCIEDLRKYIFGPQQDKVFILYGLRRTGKTTLIRQILTELSEEEFSKAAFIQVSTKDLLSDIVIDLRLLEKNGYRYVFIDEVTLLEDFIEGAAVFSDIYASSGMKIVLSGADSLGFAFTKEEQLYDRCIMLHTTFIPYREFEDVLGIKGIDEYIRFGGTMSLSGRNYNSETEDAINLYAKSAGEYVDTAIARNIQHSLKLYQYGGHFRQLLDLYEKNELTNVINRVVENINHSFTLDVVERTFKSHDISVTAKNLLKDREAPLNIKEYMDIDSVTKGIMKILDILNKEDQAIDIEESHMVQIKEYLELLDLIMEIDIESLPSVKDRSKLTVITQPGLRYAQACAVVDNILQDDKLNELSVVERKRILDRLTNEICGRMMEDIVLLETKIACPDKKVFKLQFAIGEFDMVVFDPKELNCKIYEVKYSKERVKDQYRHLVDPVKCEMTSHRFGEIVGRYVIYRGEDAESENVRYLNVEKYLKWEDKGLNV